MLNHHCQQLEYHILPLIVEVAKDIGMKGVILDYYNVFPRPSYKEDPKGSLGHDVRIVRKRLSKFDNIKIIRGIHSQKSITAMMEDSRFNFSFVLSTYLLSKFPQFAK